jgi:iron complex outermembrane receptor protein
VVDVVLRQRIKSDGYRVNNALDQRNGVGNINYTTPDLTAFLTLSGDDQKLGFPGGRLVDPSIGLNQLVTDRRARHAVRLCQPAGRQRHRRLHQDAVERRRTDRRWRRAGQEAAGRLLRRVPLSSFSSTYVDAKLQTWSITPRLSIKNVDLRNALEDPDRHRLLRCDLPPESRRIQRLPADPHVRSVAADARRLLAAHHRLLPTTDFSYGGRVQNTSLSARDRFDPTAPFAFDTRPSRSTAMRPNTRCMSASSIASTTCSRCSAAPRARSARPRRRARSSGPAFDAFFNPIPGQLSAEDPDLARRRRRLPHQGRRVPDAIEHLQHGPRERDPFQPGAFFNVNLDPTRRYGSETSASLRVSDSVLLRGGVLPIPARCSAKVRSRATTFRWCRATPPMRRRHLEHLAEIPRGRCHGARLERALHGQRSGQHPAPIPANATVDFKLSGAYEHFLLVAQRQQCAQRAVLRLRDRERIHADGRFSAYPLPGRTYMVKAGATF